MRAVLLLTIALAACGGTLPQPRYAPHTSADLLEVPSAPPPPRPENVPAQPDPAAVWVDGEWTWTGRRWSWQRGAWVIPPAGASFSPWLVVIGADAHVYYAEGIWRNAAGATIEDPTPIPIAGERPRRP